MQFPRIPPLPCRINTHVVIYAARLGVGSVAVVHTPVSEPRTLYTRLTMGDAYHVLRTRTTTMRMLDEARTFLCFTNTPNAFC